MGALAHQRFLTNDQFRIRIGMGDEPFMNARMARREDACPFDAETEIVIRLRHSAKAELGEAPVHVFVNRLSGIAGLVEISRAQADFVAPFARRQQPAVNHRRARFGIDAALEAHIRTFLQRGPQAGKRRDDAVRRDLRTAGALNGGIIRQRADHGN